MSCRRYRKLLHLSRPGELSDQEADVLSRHLVTCRKCSAEFKRIQSMDRAVDRLRSTVPVLTHPDSLVETLLSRIRRLEHAPVPQNPRGVAGRLMNFLLMPSVRYGTAGVALLAIGLFMAQEVAMLNSVNALEGKIAISKPTLHKPEVGYSINAEAVDGPADLYRLQKLVLAELEVGGNGRVVVSRRTIEQFVDGMGPGPVKALRLSTMIGGDLHRVEMLLRYLERNATAIVVF